ncbi:MAG TPA: HTH domain-containing protein, partial [Candidatus Saccharicenans sp.]|nr:HTH domain-containing protein [Candidatus Saccharicenans sp.]
MSYKRLENKEEVVLNAIVEVYLQTGKPVSSASLAQKLNNIISPATIRNVMAELEKEGYLYQPHTSAGRIPTDLGIKFYVNHLLDSTSHDRLGEVKITSDNLAVGSGELDRLLVQVSQVLADNSDNLAFVVSPHISQINFDQVKFIKLKDNNVMIVLLSTFNLIQTEIFTTRVMFTQNELDQAALYLNQHFMGKNLS